MNNFFREFRFRNLILTCIVAISLANVCTADQIYNVNQTIGSGSVTGTITTDGNTGVLHASDITDWNLVLNGVGAVFTLTQPTSTVVVGGNQLTATATDLYFNFSATDNSYLLFQQNLFSGQTYYADGAYPGFAGGGSPVYQGASVVPIVYYDPSSQYMSVSGNQIIATAGNAVPEPSTFALAGLGGLGLAIGAYRRRRAAV